MKKWFAGLDSLRALLALTVLLSHFDNVYAMQLINADQAWQRMAGHLMANIFNGTAAVIAFFVVSGFVIHYPNKNGIADRKDFWIKRSIRILLPLAVIVVIGIRHHPERFVWSLGCELIYYAIYPFLAAWRVSWWRKLCWSYALSFVIILIGARNDVHALLPGPVTQYHGYYWQLGIFFTSLVGLPCWLLGVWLAERIGERRAPAYNKLLLLRVAVILAGLATNILKQHYFVSYILTMNLIAPLFFYWLSAEITYYQKAAPYRALELMGKWSYSLYICHPIIYAMLLGIIPYGPYTYPLFILITLTASYVFYILVERPSHRFAVNWKAWLISKKV